LLFAVVGVGLLRLGYSIGLLDRPQDPNPDENEAPTNRNELSGGG